MRDWSKAGHTYVMYADETIGHDDGEKVSAYILRDWDWQPRDGWMILHYFNGALHDIQNSRTFDGGANGTK